MEASQSIRMSPLSDILEMTAKQMIATRHVYIYLISDPVRTQSAHCHGPTSKAGELEASALVSMSRYIEVPILPQLPWSGMTSKPS